MPESGISVQFAAPVELSPEVSEALNDAVAFYHCLLTQPDQESAKVRQYLHKRGVSDQIIRDFNIGYARHSKMKNTWADPFCSGIWSASTPITWHFTHSTGQGLFRLRNDGGFFSQYVDFRKEVWGMFGIYADYFAGRITFPIYDQKGNIHGIMGRRPDNRGRRWVKQQADDTDIQPRSWLYGIYKAARYIRHYKTVVIVEGIFDYFAFFNLLQDQGRPIVVSTLGTILNDTTKGILEGLGVQNDMVAYDWDEAGKKGIHKIARKTGATVYYLGGMEPGEDPAEKLQSALPTLDGFALGRLTSAAKRIPVH